MQGDDVFLITLAVPGFRPEEIEIVAHHSQLTVTGRKEQAEDQAGRVYLHRGIAARSFEKRFELADYVEVKEASMDSGLLRVTLKREVPEAMKPHRIPIGAGSPDSSPRNHQRQT